VMQLQECAPGDVVIRQGDPGDRFYVVDGGTYDVRVRSAAELADAQRDGAWEGAAGDALGPVVHGYAAGGHFGELALMYSKPRAASIVCVEAGRLWALDRGAFRTRLMKSSRRTILRTLRGVAVLRSLDTLQLQRLEETLTEQTFENGRRIIAQGEIGDAFFVIREGGVRCTVRRAGAPQPAAGGGGAADAAAAAAAAAVADADEEEVMALSANEYFGERAIMYDEPRAASVWAVGPATTVLTISRSAFEEVLGPLEAIIDADRRRRERETLEEAGAEAHAAAAAAGQAGRMATVEEEPIVLLPTPGVRARLALAAGADGGVDLAKVVQQGLVASVQPPEGHCSYSVVSLGAAAAGGLGDAAAKLGAEAFGGGGRFGLKTLGAAKAEEEQQQAVLANERWLWGSLPHDDGADSNDCRAVVPRLLATCVDRAQHCAHALIATPLVAEFTDAVDALGALGHGPCSGGGAGAEGVLSMSEDAARFYVGCAVLALDFLHGARVLYRALAPELLLLSETGYLQVSWMR